MWQKTYRDYEEDKPLIKYQVEPGQGIIGCEMHDLNGWGNIIHVSRKKRDKGFMETLLSFLDSDKEKEK
jgi:hypothetical protein